MSEMTEPPTPRRRWRFYRTRAGHQPARVFLDALVSSARIQVLAAMRDVQRNGLRAGGARHLRGDIYEVRVSHEGMAFRVLFATEGRASQILLALEGFNKKTQKTPPATIALAERRLKDWRDRGGEDG